MNAWRCDRLWEVLCAGCPPGPRGLTGGDLGVMLDQSLMGLWRGCDTGGKRGSCGSDLAGYCPSPLLPESLLLPACLAMSGSSSALPLRHAVLPEREPAIYSLEPLRTGSQSPFFNLSVSGSLSLPAGAGSLSQQWQGGKLRT